MKQNLFSDRTPRFGVFSAKIGSKHVKVVHLRLKWAKNELNWSQIVQKMVFLAHFGFFLSKTIFYGKCGMPFSRGDRDRHFEHLFVAFHRRIVSTYDVEGCKMLQMEPIS